MTDTLPTWDEMSDLDKGAALMHLHKRDYEGISYAVENYPCRYFDDPRLTALTTREASRHAAQFGAQAEALTGDEHERLYDAALAEPDRRCLWGVRRTATDRVQPVETRERAMDLLTVAWPKYSPDDDTTQYALMYRNEPGGEFHQVDIDEETA